MRTIHFAVCALFLTIAYVQLNDPDPLYWIVVYVGTAAVACGRGFGRHSRFWTTVLIGAASAGMVVAAPSLFEFITSGDIAELGNMDHAHYIEPAREFGGLSLALGFLLYSYKTGAG